MGELERLKRNLKSGEYDGSDLMKAWCMLENQNAQIKELQKENELTYEESASNADWMYKQFYANKPDDVGFELCDTASGIQTQIDCMLVGIKQDFDKQADQIKELRDALEAAFEVQGILDRKSFGIQPSCEEMQKLARMSEIKNYYASKSIERLLTKLTEESK